MSSVIMLVNSEYCFQMGKNIPQVLDGIHTVFVAPFSSTMWDCFILGAQFTIGMHTSCVKPLSNMFGATLTLLRAGIAKGYVFLKCHVGGLSVCGCICDSCS